MPQNDPQTQHCPSTHSLLPRARSRDLSAQPTRLSETFLNGLLRQLCLHLLWGCHKAHHKCIAKCTLGKERPAVVLSVIVRFPKLASRTPGAAYLQLLHLPPGAGSCLQNPFLQSSCLVTSGYLYLLLPRCPWYVMPHTLMARCTKTLCSAFPLI